MQHSEQFNELAAALAKAQGQFKPARKDGRNPALGNSSYATFDSIVAAVQKPLADNGIAFTQPLIRSEDGLIVLETWLLHTSGQFIMSDIAVVSLASNRGTNEMQALGSTLTYLKRYSLAALVGISVDDDDDGNRAEPPPTQKKQQPAGNGNGHKPKAAAVPNSPQALVNLVDKNTNSYYGGKPSHLFNAIRKHLGEDLWTWPKPDDVQGWRVAYAAGVDYANGSKATNEPKAEQVSEATEPVQDEIPF